MSRNAVRFTLVESRRCVQFVTVVDSVSGSGAKEMERAPTLYNGAPRLRKGSGRAH